MNEPKCCAKHPHANRTNSQCGGKRRGGIRSAATCGALLIPAMKTRPGSSELALAPRYAKADRQPTGFMVLLHLEALMDSDEDTNSLRASVAANAPDDQPSAPISATNGRNGNGHEPELDSLSIKTLLFSAQAEKLERCPTWPKASTSKIFSSRSAGIARTPKPC